VGSPVNRIIVVCCNVDVAGTRVERPLIGWGVLGRVHARVADDISLMKLSGSFPDPLATRALRAAVFPQL